MILTIFFCCRLLFSCRKTVSEYSVPLFYEGSCGQPFLNRYGIIWKSTCSCTLGMYNVFDRYLYSRCIAISKEHLHPYLWLVLSLFQEATWSNLVFSRVLCFFAVIPFFFKGIELIHNSSCSCPFGGWLFFCYEREIARN